MSNRRITYIGALGHSNVGDEALFEINKKVFKSYELVPSLRRQCSGITLLGGGTLIPDWTVLTLPNTYNYAFGVGVKHPSFFQRNHPLWIHPVAIEQTRKFNFRLLGVRGHMSKETLARWGIDSEVVGDPCLLFEPSRYSKRENEKIAINVGVSGGGMWGGDEERVIEETIKLCQILVGENYRPTLVPFWVEDVPYIQRISSQTKIRVFEDWRNTQKLLDFISSCHILVGLKLHSLVFSAATHTPFVSIEYRPKCQDFAESVGFGDFNIRTSVMTAKRAKVLIDNLIHDWDDMQSILRERVRVYREKLSGFAVRITNDIETLPEDKWPPRYLSLPKWFFHKYSNLIRKRLD